MKASQIEEPDRNCRAVLIQGNMLISEAHSFSHFPSLLVKVRAFISLLPAACVFFPLRREDVHDVEAEAGGFL